MLTKDRLLLVEGASDKAFFEQICADLSLKADVQVAPPRDVGGRHNSKEGVLRILRSLLNQMQDGSLRRLSVIVDADFRGAGGLGCAETLGRIESVLNEFGFTRGSSAPQQRGLIFKHSDGLADLGVWIMPDNRRDGSLEDFVQDCMSAGEKSLFLHAQEVVAALPVCKFGDTQRTKAEIASWLAWQRLPGRRVEFALTEKLIDCGCPLFDDFSGWLQRIFR